MRLLRSPFIFLSFLLLLPLSANAAPRDVQIVEVDFQGQIIELFNFGSTPEDLSNWRFCSHDATQVRRYSSTTALNGLSIGAGESLFIHLLSDSDGAPNSIDRPAGNFADPFTPEAHGLQIYFLPESSSVISFGNGDQIADHVQWSIDGVENRFAGTRSGPAQSGGVWTNQFEWVVTAADSPGIMLIEEANGEILHSPQDYTVVPEPGLFGMLLSGLSGLVVAGRIRRP